MVFNQSGILKDTRPWGRMFATFGAALMLAIAMFGSAFATSHAPSTNEENKTNGWAYVEVESEDGEAELTLNSTRGFFSCFEYRTDGDTEQKDGDTNPNPAVQDGLYPYKCVNNSTDMVTVQADEYVEVRMVFGAEKDERFDWTRFKVEQPAVAETKDDCKNGGFAAFGFKNQGQCIASVQSSQNSKHNRE